jgi:hypothetical protein
MAVQINKAGSDYESGAIYHVAIGCIEGGFDCDDPIAIEEHRR